MRAALRFALALLALAAVATPSRADTAAPAPRRYVIAIGYNAGPPDPRPALQYADDDAARFYLQQLPVAEKAWLLTTFDPDSARQYPELSQLSRAPSLVELARVLGELGWELRRRGAAEAPSELVFYFAGHGAVSPGGEGYLVLADGELTRTELFRQVVQGSPTDLNHLVLDACAAYFMVSARGELEEASSGKVRLTAEALDVLDDAMSAGDAAAWARTGVFVSTSSSAAVHETSALGSGIFSYLLRSALAGAGDTDGDGRVEYAEAAAFIAASSADLADPRARLDVHVKAPLQRPHAPLNDLTRGGVVHFLEVPGDSAVHVRILDASGAPYAELHREGGAPVRIGLVGSPFFLVQAGEREALLVPRSPGAYALSSLDFRPAPRSRSDVDGPFAQLFARPFGAEFLRGFLATSEMTPPRAAGVHEVAYAEGGAPPFEVPLRPMSVGVFAGAAALAAVAAGLSVGNLTAYGELEKRYRETASVDDRLAFEVEAWRTGATITLVAAGALALTAGALWGAAELVEEEEPWR